MRMLPRARARRPTRPPRPRRLPGARASRTGALGAGDVAAYAASRDIRIITPGSTAGIPLNLIESLDPPSAEVMADEEEFRDQIDGVVTALLGLIGIKADPIESREYILLATLIDHAWRQNQALTLEALIGQVANPPIDKVGALPLDVVYPPARPQQADAVAEQPARVAADGCLAHRASPPTSTRG